MKSIQICPICGRKIEIIDDYYYYKATHDIRDMTSNRTLLSRKTISACKNCGNPIYNTNRKFILVKNFLDLILLIIAILIGMNTDFKYTFYVLMLSTFISIPIWKYIIFYSRKNHQHFILLNQPKIVFCATFTSNKKTNELFKNNILEIKNGNQKCKIIVAKKIEENQYAFTFVEYEKDDLKQMLEKYNVFQLTNGIDILGNLEVIHKYSF